MLNDCGGFGVENKFEKRFNVMWNFTIGIIVFVFIMIIAAWIVMASLAIKGAKEVKQHGLKSLVEEVWNGKESK